ncbi:hypothetical protein C0992_009068 [Termitomyces sp. T32_za158]|nr:hypothetical protein C0992_009068 [Termitomyces sp. T32_za158]
MSPSPRRQSDLPLLRSMILQHCSPERVAVTLAGNASEYMLITTRNTLPVEGMIITTSTCSIPLSISTNTLRSFLSFQSTLAPFLVYAPQTCRAHLVTDPSTVTFANPGPFVLCPALNIRSTVYISILSPHKSAECVETAVSNLPTPPPSPEWTPRSIMPLDSSSQLNETAPSTPAGDGEDSGTQDVSNVKDESSSRLSLRAVALGTRYFFLFVLRVVYKLLFGESTADEEGEEHAADVQPEAPDEPVTTAVDTQAGGLDRRDIKNDHDCADNGVREDFRLGRCASKISGNECPRVVWVELDGSSTVRLVVCEGETNGVVSAELNGKRVPVSRTSGSGTRVEFWELTVDVGGMLRISYDHDEVNVCV